MYSNKLYTPLRYPGGKARFAPFIAEIISSNGLQGGHYLEPYAGGAGVALELLFHGHVAAVHINDADPAVHAFWVAATQHTDRLIELVRSTPVNMDQWQYWRALMLGQQIEDDVVRRGFATLFMNRTNRSGILKGGVIGGKKQAGAYQMDARFMRDALCDRLARIGLNSANIHVYGEDALALLKRCHQFVPRRCLIYLDPPYYVKGQGLYRNFYSHEDHIAVAKLLQGGRLTRPWIVSYDSVEQIHEMYAYSRTLSYGLNYTAQRRYQGSEAMFFSDRLNLPLDVKSAKAA